MSENKKEVKVKKSGGIKELVIKCTFATIILISAFFFIINTYQVDRGLALAIGVPLITTACVIYKDALVSSKDTLIIQHSPNIKLVDGYIKVVEE